MADVNGENGDKSVDIRSCTRRGGVFRGVDRRLGRPVAIKFVDEKFSAQISSDGGNPLTIIALPAFDRTAAWSSTNEILSSPENRTPPYSIRDSGGTSRQITKPDESGGENSHRFVRFLPDGRRFLFSARCGNRENNSLRRQSCSIIIDACRRTRRRPSSPTARG
jgi:hypothetical protein